MLDLDDVLAAAENPPFDRARRIGVKIEGSLGEAPLLTLSTTLRAGNGGPESAAKVIKTIRIRSREGLDEVIGWVMHTTQTRRLAALTIDEGYAAADPCYHGAPADFARVLDARLAQARALVAPQVLIAIHPVRLGGEDGEPEGCVCWARFQGVLVTPHVISVMLFDQDFTAEERALWPILESWSINVAGVNCVSLG
jgi:hypothetical protein